MATVQANGLELWYETFGDSDDPPLLLIGGLGAQAIDWPEEFCWGFASRGFHVIRFDNRDAGLSSGFDDHAVDLGTVAGQFLANEAVDAPYLLADLAADCLGLLDGLGVGAAHVLGMSMGGMVAQCLALEAPERVASLTSLMANTGERDLLLPGPDVLPILLSTPPEDREGAIAMAVRWAETFGTPDHIDLDLARDTAAAGYDRAYRPGGIARQLVAIVASPSRAERLGELRVPTLVIHGSADRLIRPEGGRRVAELVEGATLVEIEGMGHDLPQAHWAQIIEQVTLLASGAALPDL